MNYFSKRFSDIKLHSAVTKDQPSLATTGSSGSTDSLSRKFSVETPCPRIVYFILAIHKQWPAFSVTVLCISGILIKLSSSCSHMILFHKPFVVATVIQCHFVFYIEQSMFEQSPFIITHSLKCIRTTIANEYS